MPAAAAALMPPHYPGRISHPGYLSFHDPRNRVRKPKLELVDGGLVKIQEPAPYAAFAGQPGKFMRDVVGIRLYPKQEEILEATEHHRRVGVSSCHSAGKSFFCACLMVYNFNCYRPMLGMSTAPGFTQVRDLIWREVNTLYTKSLKPLFGIPMTVRLEGASDWWARGIAAKDPNAFQGRHNLRVVIVADEAQGIKNPAIWEAIETNMAGGDARMLIVGNPVEDEGYFYDAMNTDDRWERFFIDAHLTPNVEAGRIVIPGVVSPEWVADMRKKTKGKGREWTTRVLGQFYKGSDEIGDQDRIGPRAWVEAAYARGDQMQPGHPVRIGVDVGGDGDDESVIATRCGRLVLPLQCFAKISGTKLGRRVFRRAWKLRAASIAIDMGGGWGSGCRDAVLDAKREFLRRLKQAKRAKKWTPECTEALAWVRALKIIGVKPTTKPKDGEKYRYRRDEIWHGAREALNPENPNAWGLSRNAYRCRDREAVLEEDELTRKQLNSVRWKKNAKDRIWVWGHDYLAKKGYRSPDRAQAIVLTAVEDGDAPPAAGVTGSGDAPAEKGRRSSDGAVTTRNGLTLHRATVSGSNLVGPRWRQGR